MTFLPFRIEYVSALNPVSRKNIRSFCWLSQKFFAGVKQKMLCKKKTKWNSKVSCLIPHSLGFLLSTYIFCPSTSKILSHNIKHIFSAVNIVFEFLQMIRIKYGLECVIYGNGGQLRKMRSWSQNIGLRKKSAQFKKLQTSQCNER